MPQLDRQVISIGLFGHFRIAAPDGSDLTPRAVKTQALVALLATGRGFKRSRAWLQDHLWSDRAPKQAAGSLRQALHDLKRGLGAHSEAVIATRGFVALDPASVRLVERGDAPASEMEFLMGMDVRDEEFNDWLREMRAHFDKETRAFDPATRGTSSRPPAGRLRIALVSAGTSDPDLIFLEGIVLEGIQRTLGEAFDVDFSLGLPSDTGATSAEPAHFVIRVQGIRALSGQKYLRASLESAASLRSYWSQTQPVAETDMEGGENLAGQSLAHQCVSAFAGLLVDRQVLVAERSATEADILAATALRRMFTMRAEDVAEAGRMLDEAIALRPRGLYHAWQAQVLSIQHVEQQVRDIAGLREKADGHVRYALEREPLNSNVLSAAANARLIFENDLLQSSTLARQSVALNRSNPLSWFAWANANLYGGAPDIAYAAAVTAQALGARSSIEFWTAFQRSLSAAVTGRLNEALSYASVSHALAPSFRPPLRYLAGIASKLGRMPDAARALDRLSELEAEFSVERMVNDPAYPVSMMRRAQLILPEQFSELG